MQLLMAPPLQGEAGRRTSSRDAKRTLPLHPWPSCKSGQTPASGGTPLHMGSEVRELVFATERRR